MDHEVSKSIESADPGWIQGLVSLRSDFLSLSALPAFLWALFLGGLSLLVAKRLPVMPGSSPLLSATPVGKRLSFPNHSYRSPIIECHLLWIAWFGHMAISEPITVSKVMGYSDWPGLSHIVTCSFLGRTMESISLEPQRFRVKEGQENWRTVSYQKKRDKTKQEIYP